MANFLGKPKEGTEPQKKGSLLGGGSQQKDVVPPEVKEAIQRIGEFNERVRLLEERLKQTREKMQVLDETFSAKIKDMKTITTNFQDQLIAMRKDYDDTKELIRRIAKDLGQTAKMSDVRVLEKYINMVDITRLVSKEDVERIVEEQLKSKKG